MLDAGAQCLGLATTYALTTFRNAVPQITTTKSLKRVEKELSPTLPQCYLQSNFKDFITLSKAEASKPMKTLSLPLSLSSAPAPPASQTAQGVYKQSTGTFFLIGVLGGGSCAQDTHTLSLIHPAPPQKEGLRGRRAGLHCWCWLRHPRPRSWPRRRCGRAA